MDELQKLFEGTDLAEDFKSKVTSILEAKEAILAEELEAKYEEQANAYAEYVIAEMEAKFDTYIAEEVIPTVEKYIDYAAKEYVTENKVEIQNKSKVDIAEKFLTGLTGLSESFNVKLPEGQEDKLAEMETKISKLQERFDSTLNEKNTLQESIIMMKKEKMIDAKSGSLTESQKEKFAKAASKIKFIDEAQYNDSINEVYASYFPSEQLREQEEQEQEQTQTTITEATDYWSKTVLGKI